MRVLRVRKEIDGFVADRLLEALWREALWLVEDGVATTEEIDDAIRYGAGLRWSFMGTFLIYRLAGGEAGMRHFLAQFGPALKLPWTKLVAPGTDGRAGRPRVGPVRRAGGGRLDPRPRAQARRLPRGGAVGTARAGLRGRRRGGGARAGAEGPRRGGGAAPLDTWTGAVLPEWIDYNGHMTEHRYLQCFGEATDALLARIGVDAAYLATKRSFYTVETHLMHQGEAREGEPLTVDTQVLGGRRQAAARLPSPAAGAADGRRLASAEQMLLHVDTAAGRSVAAEGAVLDAMRALARATRACRARRRRAGASAWRDAEPPSDPGRGVRTPRLAASARPAPVPPGRSASDAPVLRR